MNLLQTTGRNKHSQTGTSHDKGVCHEAHFLFYFPRSPSASFLFSLLLPNLSQDYRYSAGIFWETIEKQIVYHPTGIPSHFASLPRVLQKVPSSFRMHGNLLIILVLRAEGCSGIFQPNIISFGCGWKIVRLRLENRSAEIETSFGAELFHSLQ